MSLNYLYPAAIHCYSLLSTPRLSPARVVIASSSRRRAGTNPDSRILLHFKHELQFTHALISVRHVLSIVVCRSLILTQAPFQDLIPDQPWRLSVLWQQKAAEAFWRCELPVERSWAQSFAPWCCHRYIGSGAGLPLGAAATRLGSQRF